MSESNNSGFYTVIVEYAGGTYIDQIYSDDPTNAFLAWTKKQGEHDLRAWKMDRIALENLGKENKAQRLSGLSNIWCLNASFNNGLLLANVILTAQENNDYD